MFDYGDPLNLYNAKDSAREIARLTRLLGEAYVNNARLLEVLTVTEAKAEILSERLNKANDSDEDERVEAQRTIARLKTERDGLLTRVKVAEDSESSYRELYESSRAHANGLIAERDKAEARAKELEERLKYFGGAQ